jgi:signal transduction histidine kinase
MDSTGGELTLKVVVIAMAVVFILSLFVILFFIVYQRRLLSQQKAYQKDLLKAVIDSQEQERNRIARELHDDIGAMLTTTRLYSGQISTDLPTEKFDTVKTKINDLFEEMITSTRRISQDLRPVILEKLGLIEGLQSLVDTFNDAGELEVRFAAIVNQSIGKDNELNLYRIIQEMLANTLKHAQANIADISLLEENGNLVMNYKDDGQGMDKSKHEQEKGIGLKNMESRVTISGGKLRFIDSEKGVHIQVEIPFI